MTKKKWPPDDLFDYLIKTESDEDSPTPCLQCEKPVGRESYVGVGSGPLGGYGGAGPFCRECASNMRAWRHEQ